MKKTSQRSLLFRQNVGRTEEAWAHFLDGYRQCAFTSAGVHFWAGAKEAGMKGCAGGTADIFAKHGEIAAKMKSALGPGTTILGPGTTILHHDFLQDPHMALAKPPVRPFQIVPCTLESAR